MKMIYICFFFCLLNLTALFAQNKPVIKIYNDDGTFKSFLLSDLQEISFQEFSYSNICYIHTNDDSVKIIKTYTIVNMKIINIDSIPKLIFNIKLDQGLSKNDTISIFRIDSIVFKNSNNLYNKVYTTSEINLNGMEGDFNKIYNESQPAKDTSFIYRSPFDLKLKITNRMKIYGYQTFAHYGCYLECCNQLAPPSTLNFCVDSNSDIKGENNAGFDCKFQRMTFYIDTLKKVFDSVKYTLENYTKMSGIGSYQKNYDERTTLVLYSLPYQTETDKTIYCYINLKELFYEKKLIYSYYYTYGSGTHGTYTSTTVDFIKFNTISDDAFIEIKIK
jgi:hypothetical protein